MGRQRVTGSSGRIISNLTTTSSQVRSTCWTCFRVHYSTTNYCAYVLFSTIRTHIISYIYIPYTYIPTTYNMHILIVLTYVLTPTQLHSQLHSQLLSHKSLKYYVPHTHNHTDNKWIPLLKKKYLWLWAGLSTVGPWSVNCGSPLHAYYMGPPTTIMGPMSRVLYSSYYGIVLVWLHESYAPRLFTYLLVSK